MKELKATAGAYGAILGLSAVLCAGVLANGFPKLSNDGWIHSRWASAFGEQLWAGEWYPRWLTALNGGLGSPAFFYYPPLPYWVAGSLKPVVPDEPGCWRRLGVSSALALALSGLFCFLWLRRLVPPWAAAAAAVFYMAMPFHLLIDLYRRGALAEFWGMTWLPLVLGCTHAVARGERGSMVGLAVAYALLVASHLPTTLLFSLVPPAYAVLAAAQPHWLRAWFRVGAAMLLGVGLAAVYLLPALTLQDAVSMHELTRLYPYDRYFLLDQFSFPSPDGAVGTNKPMVFWAVLSILALGACASGLAWPDWDAARREQALFWGAVVGVCTLMMTPLSRPVWEAVPTLQIVQFSWRFGTVLCVATAPLLVLSLAAIPLGFAWRRLALAQVLWLALLGWFYFTLTLAWPLTAEPAISGVDRLLHDVPEYRPRWGKAEVGSTLAQFGGPDSLGQKVAFAQGQGTVRVDSWRPRDLVLQAALSSPSIILVRQYYFPGWSAWVDGRPVPVQASEPDGLVQLSLPAGTHRVELRLRPTVQERLGQIISGIALCVSIGLLIWERRQKVGAWSA